MRKTGITGKRHWPAIIQRRIQGETVTEIGKALGVSASAVSRTLHIPEVRQAIEAAHHEAQQQAARKLANIAAEGVDALLEIARDEANPAPLRAKVWRDLLDRAGHGRTRTVEHRGTVEHLHVPAGPLDPDDLRRLPDDELAALRERLLQQVEDGEPLVIEAGEVE